MTKSYRHSDNPAHCNFEYCREDAVVRARWRHVPGQPEGQWCRAHFDAIGGDALEVVRRLDTAGREVAE